MSEDKHRVSRRKFLEIAAGSALLGGLYGLTFVSSVTYGKPKARRSSKPAGLDMVIAEGSGPSDYEKITERAIEVFGGIEHFVHKGDHVVLSPNIGWMRTPDQAATTHPAVIRAVVKLCQRAGAGKITCIDYGLDDWRLAFNICGAEQAVHGTIATLLSPTDPSLYKDINIPSFVPKMTITNQPYDSRHKYDHIMQKIPFELMNADSFICMPVVKDHEAAVITISMKKLMGNIWNRKDYHRYGLQQCIAELNCAVKPTLIVADATRVLQTRGPKGPGVVTVPNKVVVGVDPVAVDSYCCQFLTVKGITPDMVPHLVLGNDLGVGQIDYTGLKIKELAGAMAT